MILSKLSCVHTSRPRGLDSSLHVSSSLYINHSTPLKITCIISLYFFRYTNTLKLYYVSYFS